jgi:hypothetical protein
VVPPMSAEENCNASCPGWCAQQDTCNWSSDCHDLGTDYWNFCH